MIGEKKGCFSSLFLMGMAISLIGYSLFMPEKAMETARNALSVFAVSVLPSLALFSVCAKILMKSGFTEKLYRLKPVALRLGMSAGGFSAFVIGAFAGFPMGAAVLAELCERGSMDKKEAASLLPFCNQAGAAFVVGTVGTSLFGNKDIGCLLFMAQTAAAFFGICITAGKRRANIDVSDAPKTKPQPFFSVITASIRESAFAMLSVCAFIVFFSLATAAFFDLFAIGLPSVIRILTGGFLEISTGFVSLAKAELSWESTLLFSGIFLGTGGISVFFQALDRTEHLFYAPKQYCFGKILSAVLCPVMALLLFECYQWKNSLFLCFAVFFSIVFLTFCMVAFPKKPFLKKLCALRNKN
ncbi:MAG: hypothetical protein IJ489_04560 [Clostridia bacterium]|nr:hypothetical protein [Clostridia bacterium]